MKIAAFDNFFQGDFSVDQIREFGLSQFKDKNLINDDCNYYPGTRSEDISSINNEISKYIISKIEEPIIQLSLGDFIKVKNKFTFNIRYHLTPEIHEFGLIHQDNFDFSGVIYLNPTPKKNSGTKICIPKKEIKRENSFYNLFLEANTTHNKEVISSFCKEKFKFNENNFEVDYVIENKYNKCVLYPSKYWHAPDRYFGQTLNDSRFCITFFVTFID